MFTVRVARKNFLQQYNYAPSATVSKSFRICWLLLVIAKKGQGELPDITVLFVVGTWWGRDVMLSTDLGCPWTKEMLLFCLLHSSLRQVRCQVPPPCPRGRGYFCSDPIPRTRVGFWKSRQEPSYSLTAEDQSPGWVQITDYTPESWPADS